jgi:membrane protein
VRRVLTAAAHDRITTAAASLAFHGFLALLPVVIAAVGLLNLVGLSAAQLHQLVHDVRVLLPQQMASVLNGELIRPPSRQVNVLEVVLGLVVGIWSSMEAMAALQVALDVAYEAETDRRFLGRRLMAFPLIGVTLVLGGVASCLLVLGGPIRDLLPAVLHPVLPFVRYAGSLVLVTLLLSAYYSLGPAMEATVWEWISPGAVVAAGGWVLTSLAFSFYLDHFGHEARTYGALAGVAVTLLWFFLTAVVVLFGAEINRALERFCEAGDARAAGTGARPAA